MPDNLAEDIAQLIAPDAPIEVQLAGRMIVQAHRSAQVGRDVLQALEVHDAALHAQTAAIGDLQDELQRWRERPTIASVLRSAMDTKVGDRVATAVATALLSLLIALASWATGVVELPDHIEAAVMAPTEAP